MEFTHVIIFRILRSCNLDCETYVTFFVNITHTEFRYINLMQTIFQKSYPITNVIISNVII